MPKDLAKEEVNFGRIIYQWTIKEFEKYNRDRRWYIFMGVIGAALLALAVFTANYLFALLIVLFVIILFMGDMTEPLDIPFAITNTGIIIGSRYYRYSELSNFWLIYNPPDVKTLYFSFTNVFRHRLQVPLMDFDPRPIRDLLLTYLPEDLEQEEEPFSDKLARTFKIH